MRENVADHFVVAIPARDEEARLERCLVGLAEQQDARCDHIVLLLNNCGDDSLDVARTLKTRLGIPLTIATVDFPASVASAGHARSRAMAIAATVSGAGGIIATTDADGVVAPDWIRRTRAHFSRGAEAVCGRALIDPLEALSIRKSLHDDDAREVAYGEMLDEIHALVDPDPDDPLPRHREESGASIACTVAAYQRAGGMAPLPAGEDRAFVCALRKVDARINHARDVLVTVSGRLEGRAAGGMAETMARRMIQQDAFVDAGLEPALHCLRRSQLRARARALWQMRRSRDGAWDSLIDPIARDTKLSKSMLAEWRNTVYFGQFWAQIEAESPVLVREPIARGELDKHSVAAAGVLAALKDQLLSDRDDRCDSSLGIMVDLQ